MSESGRLERFDTLAGYQAAMQSLVAHARKHLCFCERTLQESAFGTRASTELIVQFLSASPSSTVRILVLDPGYLLQHCPRLLLLSRRFPQRITIRIPVEMPSGWHQGFALADEAFFLKRHHWDWMRGEHGENRREFVVLAQVFEHVWALALPPAGVEQLTL